MQISKKAWESYIDKLGKINKRAADEMQKYVTKYGFENVDGIINAAYDIGYNYGGAAATLACEMYEAIATAQGLELTAIPAEFVSRDYVAGTVLDVIENAPATISDTVGALVKRTATDTIQLNAERDGAEYAWIPSGDGCEYCKYIASLGWRKAKKGNTQIRHTHANCRCELAVRFDGTSGVAGYDQAEYKKEFENADGETLQEKLKNLRSARYAAEKEKKEETS